MSFLTPADAESAFISPAADRAANVPGAALDCSGDVAGAGAGVGAPPVTVPAAPAPAGLAPTLPGRSNDTVLALNPVLSGLPNAPLEVLIPVSPPALPVRPTSLAAPADGVDGVVTFGVAFSAFAVTLSIAEKDFPVATP